MRKIFAIAILLPLLSGCALFSKEKLALKPLVSCANASQTITDACNAAVDMIEKANILAASINTGLEESYDSKLLTKAQTQAYRDRTKQADVALDEATAALKSANYSIALSKASVTKALLEAINREVAAEVAKGK